MSSNVQSNFTALGIIEPLRRALAEAGYVDPSPIQTRAIPFLLAERDLLGIAQTGTGKTAAFALPILQRLSTAPAASGSRSIRALIIAPTRELALQIQTSFKNYGRHLPLRTAVIFGGVGQNPQVETLKRGVDILVATPGRLLDLMGQGFVKLGNVTTVVFDEADRMLDMGFIPDVRRIVAALPKARQSALFSATMPGEVAGLAADLLRDPIRIDISPKVITVERIDQRVFFVEAGQKRALLVDLLRDAALARVIVFTRTKHGANKVAMHLERAGAEVEAIHGNKSQNARQRALASFKAGTTRVLVATDVAARGLDIPEVSHVINFDLPNVAESYVHRIGRTARAGADGIALSFCDPSERAYLRDIERLIRRSLTIEKRNFARIAEHDTEGTPERHARPQKEHHGSRRQGSHNHQDGRKKSVHNRRRSEPREDPQHATVAPNGGAWQDLVTKLHERQERV